MAIRYLNRYHDGMAQQITALMRFARQRAGLTARALAERAGTSHSTLVAYEQGRVHPRVDTATRVIEAAGFTLELHLAPRLDSGAAREAKARELADVLLLAAEFPSRPRATLLAAPIFGRSRP